MKEEYIFSDEYLGISETKIHFLRNRFEYKSLNLDSVQKVVIKEGKSIKNWLILLILGILSIATGLFTGYNIIDFLLHGIGSIHVEEIVFPLFLLAMGGFMIFKSLAKEKIIIFIHENKSDKFSIEEFIKNNEYENLINFFKSRDNIEFEILENV